MTASEKILFDTNILVYVQNIKSPFYKTACKWHEKAIKKEIEAVLTPQNITEFYSIVTNKQRVEKPLSIKQALEEINKYQNSVFTFIYPTAATLSILKKLIKEYKIKARKIFDVFLVATMLSNHISKILTFNQKDFVNFREIKVISF